MVVAVEAFSYSALVKQSESVSENTSEKRNENESDWVIFGFCLHLLPFHFLLPLLVSLLQGGKKQGQVRRSKENEE